MACHSRGNAEVLLAIAAITGQSLADANAAFHEAQRERPDKHHATSEEVQQALDLLSTRLGSAPAVYPAEAKALRESLATLVGDAATPSETGLALQAIAALRDKAPGLRRACYDGAFRGKPRDALTRGRPPPPPVRP